MEYTYDLCNIVMEINNSCEMISRTVRMMTYTETSKGSEVYTSSQVTYLLNGLVTNVTMPYDGDAPSERKFKYYNYDAAGRLIDEVVIHGAGKPLSKSYEYDLRGNRVKMEEGENDSLIQDVESYQYDLNNRLTEVDAQVYDFNTSNAGVLSEQYSDRYYYDNNGNMTARQTTQTVSGTSSQSSNMDLSGHGADSGLEIYRYDAFNRLSGYYTGETKASYTYNANNLRASKTVNNTKTDFVWNGQNLAVESTDSGVNTYTYDMTGIHMANQNGTVMSYIKDSHGSVIRTADAAGNAMQEAEGRADYDAFGNVYTGSRNTPFGYSGEYVDSESGNIYLRNRYYSSSTGRFITEDPAQDGLNWYVYAGNNPVSFVDPWGLAITCNEDNAETIISLLKEISGNSLRFEYKNGQINITKTYDTKHHVGQTLISDLIDSSEIVNVNIGEVEIANDDGTTSMSSWVMYNATDSEPIQVYIDPDNVFGHGEKGTYVQQPDGAIIEEDIPDFVHFGHELIHAWRDINGLFVYSWDEVGLIPYDAPQLWREEELQTMGINYTVDGVAVRNYSTYNGIISENGLRLENGLNTRVSYYYAY